MASRPFTTCLWFDGQAEEAAHFYVSIFKNSKLGRIGYYNEAGPAPAGEVLAVDFVANGQKFVALNGGPQFKFSEAISFQVHCDSQKEVDYFWDKLTDGGEEGPCGWLKDKFGLSWQVVPTTLIEMVSDRDPAKVQRVTKAFLQMKKFDISALERAFEGQNL